MEKKTSIERRVNQRRVLKALQEGRALSRRALAEQTGISYPTVSKIIEALAEAQLVEELAGEYSGQGRPGKVYRLRRDARTVAGLVIGPVHCDLVAGGLDGSVDRRSAVRFKTPRRRETLLKSVARHVALLAEKTGQTLSGIGVSVPGLIDRVDGRIVECPNLHQLDGCLLGPELQGRLAIPVAVVQTMHAQFLAERLFGLAREAENFVLLNYHGGLGICACLDGQVMRGAHGLAGEFGHVTVEPKGAACGCGNRGCLETVATDQAVAQAVSRRAGRELDIEDVLALTASGELDASDELQQAMRFLAIGVASALNIFNPELILVCGRFLGAQADLVDRFRDEVQRRALAPAFDVCRIEVRTDPPQEMEQLGAVASIVHELTLDFQTVPSLTTQNAPFGAAPSSSGSRS